MSIAFPTISWANGSNIYEVNLRQYTREGTFAAFLEHIPRLRDMGVDMLWFMPVTPISEVKRQGSLGSYYAASSYTKIDAAYGTDEEFRNLVSLAQQHGMKVLIDWVANHTGYDHEWTKTNPEYFRKDSERNFTEIYGWEDVIDLDYEVPELRKAMINCMKYWVNEFNIDGFRCDMARTVPVDFWVEARNACDNIKPLFWLAECEIVSYHEAFDVTYGWEVMRACDKYFKGELPFSDISEALLKYTYYPIGSRKLLFTSNHDENSYWGTEYEKYGVAAKAMAVFSCTFPGIPLIYSGQEKPNLRRLAFFEKDHIDWEGKVELHDFYRQLLALRKTNKALQQDASVLLLKPAQTEVLAYLCRREKDRVLVILNLAKEERRVEIEHPAIIGSYNKLFENNQVTLSRSVQFNMPAGDYQVLYSTDSA